MGIFFIQESSSSIFDDIVNASQLVIAIVNIALIFYIFVYQRKKDKKDEIYISTLNKQTIRLQWFKELIITPNLTLINEFFNEMESNTQNVGRVSLNPGEKRAINDKNLVIVIEFRKRFIWLLKKIDLPLYKSTLEVVDKLFDMITEEMYDENSNVLTDTKTLTRVQLLIHEAKSNLLFNIWNFDCSDSCSV